MRIDEFGKIILQKLLNALSYLESLLRRFEESNIYKNFLAGIKNSFDAVFQFFSFLKTETGKFFRFIFLKLEEKKIGPRFADFLVSVFRFLRRFFDRIGLYATKKLFIVLPIICLFYLTIIAFIVYQSLYGKYYWEGENEKRFSVKPRKNLKEISNELKQNDIIRNALIFKIIVKLSGNEEKLISRNYVFKNGMNNLEVLSILTEKTESVKFRVPEGMTLKQISKLVESKLQLSSAEFLKATKNDSLFILVGLEGKIKNLEGFLYPDTYYLPAAIDEETLVEILLKEFVKKVYNNPEVLDKLKENKTDLLSVVTLASIIEAETPVKSEMPTISGVYHNRLKKKMKLQADPTVQYALPDGPKTRLLYEDLKIDSRYNTYKYAGLPPGPINNPGLAAIMASLNPEKNEFLYFVATGTGGHKFSVTYQEHQKAIQEYRQKQR
jgi:UPF0755 protein